MKNSEFKRGIIIEKMKKDYEKILITINRKKKQ